MDVIERKIIEIHCDESSHELLNMGKEKHHKQFLGIGAIFFLDCNKEKFKNEIRLIKKKFNIPWEFKWIKLSNSNIDFYKALVDWFIRSKIKFRLVRIDTENIDLEFWHNRDPELGFYKFYYQCLKHILREDYDYRIFTDYKTNRDKNRLKTLKFYLDFYSSTSIIDIQALASKDSVFIQLADLFTGAVIACHNKSISSQAKLEFCKYLANKLGKSSLVFCSTKYGDPKFNIFCLEFGRIS